MLPERQIRAVYSDDTIRVFQAYSEVIADAALKHGTFVSPLFSMTRMTWIKPSFLWMMYRAGWGYKDDGQRRILAIDITHEGFNWALAHSCPSERPHELDDDGWRRLKGASPVRIQWDPERNLHLAPLAHRTIQIGLSGVQPVPDRRPHEPRPDPAIGQTQPPHPLQNPQTHRVARDQVDQSPSKVRRRVHGATPTGRYP